MIRFPYKKQHIKEYFLLNFNTPINKLKNYALFIIPIFIFLVNFLGDTDGKGLTDGFSNTNFPLLSSVKFKYELLYKDMFLIYLVTGFVFSYLFSLIIHSFSYVYINKTIHQQNQILSTLWEATLDFFTIKIYSNNALKDLFFKVISPDIVFASYYKKRIVMDIKNIKFLSRCPLYVDRKEKLNTFQWSLIRIRKKSFIEFSNWSNIILSMGLLLLICVLISIPHHWVLIIICYRIVSRGAEIIVAFYNDVVNVYSKQFYIPSFGVTQTYKYINGFSTSLIRQSGRLSLAIHSLIEMIVLFAIAYFLYFQMIVVLADSVYLVPFTEPGTEITSTDAPTLTETLLLSFTLGIFNISYGVYPNVILGLLHASQILISGILILLSIAQYLNADKKLNDEDEFFYNEIANLNYIKSKNPTLSLSQILKKYNSNMH